MIKVQQITTLKKQVPQIKKALVLPYETKTQLVKSTYKSEGLLTRLARGIKDLFTTKTEIRTPQIQTIQTPVSTYHSVSPELQTIRNEYSRAYSEYCQLLGYNAEKSKFGNWELLSLFEIKNLISELRLEVSHEKMMQGLEKQFTKGTNHYLPKWSYNGTTMKPTQLTGITPNENAKYKEELKRMCGIFIDNSHKVDKALSSFNGVTGTFFREASQSIKEIYALKNDSYNRVLERIPKLGIIPKALRVKDQIRLTKCIMKDYESVTNNCVAQGMDPLIQKYVAQYNTIQNYVSNNKVNAFLHKRYTDLFMSKIADAKDARLSADKKMLNVYASCGMNLNNMCETVKNRGLIDLAKKTAITFASLL